MRLFIVNKEICLSTSFVQFKRAFLFQTTVSSMHINLSLYNEEHLHTPKECKIKIKTFSSKLSEKCIMHGTLCQLGMR